MAASPMKILILSRSAESYSTRRLKEASLARGHRARVLDTLRFSVLVESERPRLLYRDKPLSRYDAVIPRVGASVTLYGTAVVRQFEQMGVFVLSSSRAIRISRDKLLSFQLLCRHRIDLPPTVFVRDPGGVEAAVARVGGPPVIVKVLEGTQGTGVFLAESTEVAEAIVDALHGGRQNVLVQQFVAESRGRDIRAFVVGGRVVAAMRRVAAGEEFRSNLHRGGRGEPVELTPDYERVAIRAAQIMGLRVAGVDMLESDAGPKVLEVNSSPGLEGIERTTGVDVAGAIVEVVEEQFLLPEVDLQQRLTLDQGLGVTELQVGRESELAHRRLAELALEARGIRVLSIERGSVLIPNPGGDRTLLPGDQLICYGPLRELRRLVPTDREGRRRRRRRQE
jgi:ribosomal protein S6--L-glutamate ligase